MGDLYMSACQTVAYLGQSNGDIDWAFDDIETNKDKPENSLEMTNAQKIIAIQVMFRSWFGRVWIYQELVLSKAVWIQCGRSRVTWETFCKCIPESCNSGQQDSSPSKVGHQNEAVYMDRWLQLVGHMDEARQKFQESLLSGHAPASLFDVLLARRGFGAQNSRDMIFGHLAVTRLHNQKLKKPGVLVMPTDEVESLDGEVSINFLENNYTTHLQRSKKACSRGRLWKTSSPYIYRSCSIYY
jgi:hypothetical protein